jgi:hypothetical protein
MGHKVRLARCLDGSRGNVADHITRTSKHIGDVCQKLKERGETPTPDVGFLFSPSTPHGARRPCRRCPVLPVRRRCINPLTSSSQGDPTWDTFLEREGTIIRNIVSRPSSFRVPAVRVWGHHQFFLHSYQARETLFLRRGGGVEHSYVAHGLHRVVVARHTVRGGDGLWLGRRLKPSATVVPEDGSRSRAMGRTGHSAQVLKNLHSIICLFRI